MDDNRVYHRVFNLDNRSKIMIPENYNSRKLSTEIKNLWASRKYRDEFPLLNRTLIIDCTDEKILPFIRVQSKLYTADLIVGDDSEIKIIESGTTDISSLPNIKGGTKIEKEIVSEEDYAQLAEGLIKMIYQRMESLIIQSLTGEEYTRTGIRLKFQPYNQTFVKTDWSTTNCDCLADMHPLIEQSYDRITLAEKALLHFAESESFQKLTGKSGHALMVMKRQDYQELVRSSFKLKEIEIYEGCFRQHNPENPKRPIMSRIFPDDRILFTKIKNDNAKAFDWGNAIVTESIVTSIMENPFDTDGEYSPIGYFTGEAKLNDKLEIEKTNDGDDIIINIRAWGVARGYPRIHDSSYSAVLHIFDENQEAAEAAQTNRIQDSQRT